MSSNKSVVNDILNENKKRQQPLKGKKKRLSLPHQ